MVYFAAINVWVTHHNVTIMSRCCSVGHKMFAVRDILGPHSCCVDVLTITCIAWARGSERKRYVQGRH